MINQTKEKMIKRGFCVTDKNQLLPPSHELVEANSHVPSPMKKDLAAAKASARSRKALREQR